MALALARSVLNSCGYDPEAAAQSYAWWYESNPYDIGGTTATARSAATAVIGGGGSAAQCSRVAARRIARPTAR
jgi:hypothetical protein